MTGQLKIDVKYKDYDAPELVKEQSRRIMVFSGVRLEAIFRHESKQRPDGLGNPDGAKDIGGLSDSIHILSTDYDHVAVGTNLSRARKLAFGESDPTTSFDDIFRWAVRKDILKFKRGSKAFFKSHPEKHPFVKNVTKKIRTKGPIPNPFMDRTKKQFIKEWPSIYRQAVRE